MRSIADVLKSWDFNICTVFLLDTHFVLNSNKFLSGALTTLSTMVALEVFIYLFFVNKILYGFCILFYMV